MSRRALAPVRSQRNRGESISHALVASETSTTRQRVVLEETPRWRFGLMWPRQFGERRTSAARLMTVRPERLPKPSRRRKSTPLNPQNSQPSLSTILPRTSSSPKNLSTCRQNRHSTVWSSSSSVWRTDSSVWSSHFSDLVTDFRAHVATDASPTHQRGTSASTSRWRVELIGPRKVDETIAQITIARSLTQCLF